MSNMLINFDDLYSYTEKYDVKELCDYVTFGLGKNIFCLTYEDLLPFIEKFKI